MRIVGIGSSPGITIGTVFVMDEVVFDIPNYETKDPDKEMKQLREAMTSAEKALSIIKNNVGRTLGESHSTVFEAHIQMSKDPEVIEKVENLVRKKQYNVVKAYHTVIQSYIEKFSQMENEYMRGRAIDIKDVSNKVLSILLGVPLNNPAEITEEVIVCAKELSPSDTAQLNKDLVQGFVTCEGSKTSHSAIMARSLNIPAVVGATSFLDYAKNGDQVIVNGIDGYVIVKPDVHEISYHKKLMNDYHMQTIGQEKLRKKSCYTKDHIKVELSANITTPSDIDEANNVGVDGIGLFRTEYLYMKQRKMPSENDQYHAYRKVLQQMPGKKVIIRTLDIGGDKLMKHLPFDEENVSSLGNRGIRLSLKHGHVFRIQLRALLRASLHGDLYIMFPMVSTVEEIRKVKGILLEVKQELAGEGVIIGHDYKIGIMIEIPSAAMLVDKFAKEVDFVSIGTNDLIQYFFAADRHSKHVAYLYQPLNPSLLRLIKYVIDHAHKEGIWVSMCGEMAGDPVVAPILLGMGLDGFSMNTGSILRIRMLFSELSKERMEYFAEKVLGFSTEREVRAYLEKHLGT